MLARNESPELMDTIATQEEMDAVLSKFEKINSFYLNRCLILHFLKPFLKRNEGNSILDIGTGGADIPIYLRRWASRTGQKLEITGIDTHPLAVDYARRKTQGLAKLTIKNARIAQLPEKYQVIIISQTLHHIPPAELAEFLRTVYDKATRAIIISDFTRSRLAFWLVKAAVGLVTANPIHRHDGPASVLRSYSSAELKKIFRELGIANYRIYNLFPRKLIVIKKT